VAATKKGSNADRAWDESLFFPASAIAYGFTPNDSSDTFPSRHCRPTLPMNGDVEQANMESLVVLLLNSLERLETNEQENEEKGEEEEEEEGGLNETERLGLVGGERQRRGIEGIEEVDMGWWWWWLWFRLPRRPVLISGEVLGREEKERWWGSEEEDEIIE